MSDLVRNRRRMDTGTAKRKRQDSGSVPVCKKPSSKTDTGSPSCWRHGSLLDIYCCTDDQIICGVCASAEHRGHTIGLVREERKRKQVLKNETCRVNTNTRKFISHLMLLHFKVSSNFLIHFGKYFLKKKKKKKFTDVISYQAAIIMCKAKNIINITRKYPKFI